MIIKQKRFVTAIMQEIENFGEVPFKTESYKRGVEHGVIDLSTHYMYLDKLDANHHASVIVGNIEFYVVIPAAHINDLRERIAAALQTIYQSEVTT